MKDEKKERIIQGIKKNFIIVAFFLLAAFFGDALTSSEIDMVCSQNESFLFRFNGSWGCAKFNDTITININNITNIIQNYSLLSNSSYYWDNLNTPSDIVGSVYWYNQTSNIIYNYNQSRAFNQSIELTNAYANIWRNLTVDLFNAYNSIWSSTYNASYDPYLINVPDRKEFYYQNNLIFGWDGSKKDSYYGGFTGTLTNGLTVGNSSVDNGHNIDNNATYFNGSTYLNYGNILSITNNPVTLCFWAKFSTNSYLVGKDYQSSLNWGIEHTTGALRFGIRNSGSAQTYSVFGATNYADSRWHFICGVVDDYGGANTNVFGYVDGALKGSVTNGIRIENSGQNFVFGTNTNQLNSFLKGFLDEVHVWNKALSSDDIMYLYNRSITQTNSYNYNETYNDYLINVPDRKTYYYQNNLVFAWDASQKDDYINKLSGTLSNGLLAGNNVSEGGSIIDLNATYFNGSTYITYGNPNSLIFTKQSITLCLWKKSSSSSTLVGKEYASGYAYGIEADTGAMRFQTRNSTTSASYSVFSANLDSKWHFICGVVDDAITTTTIYGYVDGELTGTVTNAVNIGDVGGNFNIGFHSANDFFTGSIDEVTIWNKAMSQNEIKVLYEKSAGIIYNNRILYGNFTIKGSITPLMNVTYDLGNSTSIWNNTYINNIIVNGNRGITKTINLNATCSITITSGIITGSGAGC